MAVVQPFKVHLPLLEGGPGERRPLACNGHLDDLSTTDVIVRDDADVTFDGAVEWIDGGRLVLTGHVRAPWEGVCRRCLGKAEGIVESDVREIFEPDPQDGETYELRGDEIDLEPMVREAIALDLPIAPLCKEDCAGLCPNCGINKNEESCDCNTEIVDPRWAALDELKGKLES